MENVNVLYCVLLVVGGIYLGGISYMGSPFANFNPTIPPLSDWAPPGGGKPLDTKAGDTEVKRQIKMNNKLKTDAIPEESMLAFQTHFPYDLRTKTKEGNPVLFIPLASWNPAEIDNMDELKLHKCLDNMLVDAFSKTISQSVATPGGKGGFKFYVLLNMEGTYEEEYSKEIYLEVALKMTVMLVQNYSHELGKLILINSSPNFIKAHSIIMERQPKEREEFFEVLGEGKASWAPFLLHLISEQELPKELRRRLYVDL